MKPQIITRKLRCPKCNRCGAITREEVGSTGRHDKVLGTTGCISADDHGKPICACGNKALRVANS